MKKLISSIIACALLWWPYFAVLALATTAFAQGIMTGGTVYGGTFGIISTCAMPNPCAYAGVDVIPWGTIPNFGGLSNNNAALQDTSYLGHYNLDGVTQFTNAANLSLGTRITDAFSTTTSTYSTRTAGQGGSGVFTLTDLHTNLIGISDTDSHENICVFNTPAYPAHCQPASAFTGPQVPASGILITTNMNTAGGCTNGASPCPAKDFGGLSFSLNNLESVAPISTAYEFGTDVDDINTPTVVTPYAINTLTGMYTIGSTLANFLYALPVGANAPNWATSTGYGYGAYITHPLESAEMLNGGVWATGLTVVPGDIVSPGGSSGCMYRAIVGGTTAGTAPAFNTSNCKDDTIKESTTGGGAVQWRGTNSSAQFIYQNVNASCGQIASPSCTSNSASFQWIMSPATIGTSCSITKNTQTLTCGAGSATALMVGQPVSVTGAGLQGATLYASVLTWTSSTSVKLSNPALTTIISTGTFALTGHPDVLSSTVGDAGPVWLNVGPSYAPVNGNDSWQALGGQSNDNFTGNGGYASKYGLAMSTNTYGSGFEGYNKYNADQGTGFWAMEYDAVLNVYHLLNTGSGIWTDWGCVGGTGYSCSGGVWAPTTVGPLNAITANPTIGPGQFCPFTIHNEKMSRNGLYILVVGQANYYAACNPLNNFFLWQTTTANFNTASSLEITYGGMNHWAIGSNKLVAFNGGAFAYDGYTSGVFLTVYPASNVAAAPDFSVSLYRIASQSTPQRNPQGCYVTTSVIKNPDCNLSEFADSHLSWVGDPGSDTYPACGTTYNYATLGPAFNAWQNMETCYSTVTPQPNSALPVTYGSVWQFYHTFATGTCQAFSCQFQISEYSQDAKWLFWSSDWDCQLGSSTGVAPTVWTSGTYYQQLLYSPIPSGLSSICGLPWAQQSSYAQGQIIVPLEGTGGAGAIDDAFQALNSGTTGANSSINSSQPACLQYVGGVPNTIASCFNGTNPPSATTIAATSATVTGGTATLGVLASKAIPLNVGAKVTLAGFVPSTWNGTYTVTGTVGANCPGPSCTAISSFQLAGLSGSLSGAPTTLGTIASQGDVVCDSPSDNGSGSVNGFNLTTCPGGGAFWGDLGKNNQRGDVFAAQL